MDSMELDALAAAAARRRKIEQENLKKQKQEELEVTGVSRSGRVRKKSSKLMDFESPDDIDTRVRRLPQTPGGSHRSPGYRPLERSEEAGDDVSSDSDGYHNMDTSESHFEATARASSAEWESSNSETEGAGLQGGASRQATPAHHSLYLTEKAKKKVKEGKSERRAQRKDKGQRKSRITAYMLWARGARNELIKNCPDMNFAAISKRLGEMWANVNFNERHMWKRKAKRYSMKQEELANQTSKIISNPAPMRQWTATPTPKPPARTVTKQISPTTHAQPAQQVTAAASPMYRKPGCGASDVAAHLRLLGESLAIIGERLKEHEGQIAVSGSVSVLLDTLLCSLAPLICVTRAVPAIAPPASLLQDTLDNIAYIMPGL